MTQNNSWIIFDGALYQADQPVATIASRGLKYGEGVFETLRVYAGRTLLFSKHFERLTAGMEILGMITSDEVPSIGQLKEKIAQLLNKQELYETDVIIRIQFWQEGERGYHPQQNTKLHYIITVSPCPGYGDRTSVLATVNTRRIPSESQPSIGKFTNGINYILAAQEADQKGADDALMQTVEGWVSETTIANLFWINENRIYTPSLECDLLPGITREVIISIIENHAGLSLTEGKYSLDHLYDAESVGMCNSVRELLAVQQVDGEKYNTDHPVLKELQELYSDFRNENLKVLPRVE